MHDTSSRQGWVVVVVVRGGGQPADNDELWLRNYRTDSQQYRGGEGRHVTGWRCIISGRGYKGVYGGGGGT